VQWNVAKSARIAIRSTCSALAVAVAAWGAGLDLEVDVNDPADEGDQCDEPPPAGAIGVVEPSDGDREGGEDGGERPDVV